jgi:hypothetical protein
MVLLFLIIWLWYCIRQYRQALPPRRRVKGFFVVLPALWLLNQLAVALLPLFATHFSVNG